MRITQMDADEYGGEVKNGKVGLTHPRLELTGLVYMKMSW